MDSISSKSLKAKKGIKKLLLRAVLQEKQPLSKLKKALKTSVPEQEPIET